MLKPLFHCNAKSFALGTFVSPNAKDSTFALPYARNTNMLVSLALGDANFSRHPDAKPKSWVLHDANPRRQSVEYRWHWAFWHWGWHWACTFHVVYVNFICVGHPTQTRFSVEYGLKGLCFYMALKETQHNSQLIRITLMRAFICYIKFV